MYVKEKEMVGEKEVPVQELHKYMLVCVSVHL